MNVRDANWINTRVGITPRYAEREFYAELPDLDVVVPPRHAVQRIVQLESVDVVGRAE